MMKKYLALAALIVLAACNNNDDKTDGPVDPSVIPPKTPAIAYAIVAQYPHDTSSYTQGLEFHDGKLYEGAGDYNNSSLRITDHKTGRVEKKHMLGTDSVFGEGPARPCRFLRCLGAP